MDLDLCGPSIPRMLGIEGYKIYFDNFKMIYYILFMIDKRFIKVMKDGHQYM